MGKEERKKKVKISSRSGRQLIRPKKLCTTSSDDAAPRKKRSKGQITMQKELERLRLLEKHMTSPEPRQSHAFSKQSSIPNKRDMTAKAAIENSKKIKYDNYSAATCNQPPKFPKDATKEMYAASVTAVLASKTAAALEMDNITPAQTERNQPRVDNSGSAKFNDYDTETYNAASITAIPASKTASGFEMDNITPVQTEQNLPRIDNSGLAKFTDYNTETCNAASVLATHTSIIAVPTDQVENGTSVQEHYQPRVADNGSSIVVTAPSIYTKLLQKLAVLEEQNRDLIKGQADIRKKLKEIKEKALDDDVVATTFYQPLDGYPLKTVEEFDEIEHEFKKLERQKLYRHIMGLGAVKLRDFIYIAIEQTMTDELVNKFTWLGDEQTKQLQDTKMTNIIYHAAKKCPHFEGPADKEAFKIEILQVLRTIKQRYRRTIKKRIMIKDDEKEDSEENTDDEQDKDDIASNEEKESSTDYSENSSPNSAIRK